MHSTSINHVIFCQAKLKGELIVALSLPINVNMVNVNVTMTMMTEHAECDIIIMIDDHGSCSLGLGYFPQI
jgi:nucleoside phosphorylase